MVYEDIFDAKNACDHLSGFNVCNRYLVVLYYRSNKAFKGIDIEKKQEELDTLKKKFGISTEELRKWFILVLVFKYKVFERCAFMELNVSVNKKCGWSVCTVFITTNPIKNKWIAIEYICTNSTYNITLNFKVEAINLHYPFLSYSYTA